MKNNRFPFFPILLLITAALLITCQKEYSYEGGPGGATAVYTLNTAGGNCTNTIIAGDYFAGMPLTETNTAAVEVAVSVPGNYFITTGSADGFYFSASGSFTDTGTQKIVLKATGTAGTQGNFDFTVYGRPACSFTVMVQKPIVDTAVFTLAGAPNACTSAVVDTNYIADTALTNLNTATLNVTVTAIGVYEIHTDTINGISFSGSGTFTSTGNKTVTLTGKGKPVDFGTFNLTPKTPTSACSFPVIVKPHVAGYVLESNTNNTAGSCNQGLASTFKASFPVSDSDFVTITAFVIKPGYYTIATNKVNGLSFSGTALFTAEGSQYVKLKATGTPEKSGDFTYIPSIIGPAPFGGASCDIILTIH